MGCVGVWVAIGCMKGVRLYTVAKATMPSYTGASVGVTQAKFCMRIQSIGRKSYPDPLCFAEAGLTSRGLQKRCMSWTIMAAREQTIPLEPGSDDGHGVHSKAAAEGGASMRWYDR